MEDMNAFEAIAKTLPNGFHDAELYYLHCDYSLQEIRFGLGIDMYGAMANDPHRMYRPCTVTLRSVLFVQIEASHLASAVGNRDKDLCIDAGGLIGERLEAVYAAAVPVGAFAIWIYMRGANSFIYVIAREISLDWTVRDGPARPR